MRRGGCSDGGRSCGRRREPGEAIGVRPALGLKGAMAGSVAHLLSCGTPAGRLLPRRGCAREGEVWKDVVGTCPAVLEHLRSLTPLRRFNCGILMVSAKVPLLGTNLADAFFL